MRKLFGIALVGVLFVAGTSASANHHVPPDRVEQVADVPHLPPVDAPIIDPFRLPEFDWQPGNRGLEYDTVDGQVVRASADGTVTFSGQVGGELFVTISHSPDLRTTVGFVSRTLVDAGEWVRQGEAVAIAGDTLHFTARHRGRYVDPQLLFQRYRTVVRLVSTAG